MRTSVAVAGLALAAIYVSSKGKPRRKYTTDLASLADPVHAAGKPSKPKYDVVIVGGGTAGCVLAARLSEDPSIRVLLLEAGESSVDVEASYIPAGWPKLFKSPQDWTFYTTPQAHANGRERLWPRGKMLGGCSSMNAMMYHHGCPQDFDRWATMQKEQDGASGWSFEGLTPYLRKFEKYTSHADFPGVDVTQRNTAGPVEVGHYGHFATGVRPFIDACANVGIPYTPDFNTHTGTLGVSKAMTYIDKNGIRVTAETAYLTPEVLARPNLTVATGAYVERLLFDGVGSAPRAVGVQVTDKQGRRYTVSAAKEVVLSAGALNTPQILQLSGVGAASHLSSFGIPVVADLPGVGSHLKDHAVLNLNYMDKHKTSICYLEPVGLVQSMQAISALAQYKLTGRGPLASNLGEAMAFIHTSDPKLFPPEQYLAETAPEDCAAGAGAPDFEIVWSPVTFRRQGQSPPFHQGEHGFGIHPVLLQPKSSGTVRLKSTNPLDPPVIDPQYLSDQNDIKSFIRAVRLVDRIAHTEPLASGLDPEGHDNPELSHGLSAASDDELEALVRGEIETLYHPCCTARMAPLEDGGVVDTSLRVYGIPNLRVVDASIFPEITSGHTTAPVYAVAEKAADLVKSAVTSGTIAAHGKA